SSLFEPWETSFIGIGGYPIVDCEVYDEMLYAAASNNLYCYYGNGWKIFDAPSFIVSLEYYEGKLVVGAKGGLYTFNGTNFALVFPDNSYIKPLGVYNSTLYAGTVLDNPPTLYYCNGSPDNPSNWYIDTDFWAIQDFSGPFGSIDSFAVYNSVMYVSSGRKLYSFNGTSWSVASSFDDAHAVLDMQVYNSKLYLATRDHAWRKPLYRGGTGFSGRVIEFDGINWTTTFDHDYWIFSLETYDNKLFVGTVNKIYTYDGTNWNISFKATEGAYSAISLITFNDQIYVGMGNGYIFADLLPESRTDLDLPPNTAVPEFPPSSLVPMFALLSLAAIVLTKRYRRKSKK
ncbi:MAG: hypothetical protein QXX08_10170, partial [Candidatus Bathyarchaeia archaeon]